LNSITFQVSDGQANAITTIPVDVVPLNNNPTIYIGDKNKGLGLVTQEISVSDGSAIVNKSLSLWENFYVEDQEAQDNEPMDLVILITAGEIKFDHKLSEKVETSGNEYFFTDVAKEINKLMNRMTWITTEHVQEGTITITVSDQGYKGKCLTNGVYIDTCVLKATIIAHVSSGQDGAVTNTAAIAGPAVAAAATVAAAGVAAGVGLIGAGASTSSVAATAGFDAAFATGAAQTSGIFQAASTGGTSAIFV